MSKAIIVESDDAARRSLRDILVNEGLVVEEAMDGQKGINAARAAEDLVVVFLADRLPGLSGIDTLIGLRKFLPKIPIILTMSSENRQTSQLALSRGASWFLSKPVRVEDVLVILRNLLERRKLLKTVESQVQRLNLLEKQAAALTDLGTGDLVPGDILREDEFLKRTIELIAEVLDAKKISLMLLDEQNKELFMANSNWILPSKLPTIRQPVGSGVAGKVVRDGKPMLVADAKKDTKAQPNEYALQYESTSFICTPLFHRRKVIGTISANDKRNKEPFTEADLAILNTFAHQLSMAIANLAMTHRIEREHLKMAFVSDIVNSLVSSMDPAEIYRTLLEKVRTVLRAKAGILLVGDGKGGTVNFEAESPEGEVRKPTGPVPLGSGVLERVLTKGKVVMVNAAAKSGEVDAASDFPRGMDRRNIAAMPLKAKGKVLGALVVYNKEDNLPFEDWDQEILEAIIPQASMAIKQAWLYQSLIKSIDDVVETNKQLDMANKEIRNRIEELSRLKKRVSP